MKFEKRFFGIEIRICFGISVRRVKRVSVPLPVWADDVHINQEGKVEYYKGLTPYYIGLPPHKEAREVSLTPRYKTKVPPVENEAREITVDLYL